MEISDLYSTLQASIGYNKAERERAEACLNKNKTSKGFICTLLRISVEESVDISIRQAASIMLKRNIEKHWEGEDGDEETPQFHPQDKQEFKQHLIDAIIRSAPLIRNQLLEAFKVINHIDFPDNWPELHGKMIQILNTEDDTHLLSALMVFRCLCTKFEYKDPSDIINHLMEKAAPRLLCILGTLAQTNNLNGLYAKLLKATCEIFWAVSYFKLPPALLQTTHFNSLMDSLLLLLQKPLQLHELPDDIGDQENQEWWKAEESVVSLSKRFFTFGTRKSKTDIDQQQYKKKYTIYLYPMLEAHLNLLKTMAQLPGSDNHVLTLLLQIMNVAISTKTTFKVIKDRILPMLKSTVFHLLCFTDDDAILMENDPEEYIRQSQNFFGDVCEVKMVAAYFLSEVCNIHKELYFHDYMNFIGGILTEFYNMASIGHVSIQLSKQVDGALFALGSLEAIIKKKEYISDIKTIFSSHVMLCFQSLHPHLRLRACWMARIYFTLKSDDDDKDDHGNLIKLLLEKVIISLQDAKLIVQMEAVISLNEIINNMDNLDYIKHILPNLLIMIFKIMDKIKSEHAICLIESIIDKLEDDILPFAMDLAQNLVNGFFGIYTQAQLDGDEDEDEDETGDYCFTCIRTINTLLDAMQEHHELYNQLEELIYPMITKVLDDNSQELFEDTLEMIHNILCFDKSISPRMWELWPKLHHLLFAWAFEDYNFIYKSLRIYISKGKEVFLFNKDPSYIESFNQILVYSFMEEFNEPTCHPSLKLIEVAMQNLKPNIDGYIKHYLQLTLNRLSNAQGSDTKVLCINVLANAFWYNVPLALQSLIELNSLEIIFKMWMEMIYTDKKNGMLLYFRKISDKKVNIMGLCSILQTPDEILGSVLLSGLVGIFSAIIRLLLAIKEQEEENLIENADKLNESSDEDHMPQIMDDVEIEIEEDNGEEDEAIKTDSETFSSTYEKLVEKKVGSIFGEFDDSDSDGYFYSDVSSENEDASIYNINIFDEFFQIVNFLEGNYQSRFELIKGKLDADHVNSLSILTEYNIKKKEREINIRF